MCVAPNTLLAVNDAVCWSDSPSLAVDGDMTYQGQKIVIDDDGYLSTKQKKMSKITNL